MARPSQAPAVTDSTGERLFELSHDLLCAVQTDGAFVRVNPAFERMLGWTSSELLGRSFVEFVHADDRIAAATALHATVAGSPPASVENRYLCADGSTRWLSWLLSPPDERGLVYGIGRDVTERRAGDARLHFQAALLDAAGQAVIATDLDGVVTYWSRAAERLYGWPAVEAVGRSIRDLTPAEPSREQAARILAALREGQSWTGEFVVRRRDGREFVALVVNTPVHDASGALIGVVGASIDVTTQRRMADALRESEARLRLALDAAGMWVWERDLATDQLLDGALPDYPSFLAAIHPDDRDRVAEAVADAVARNGEFTVEYRMPFPDQGDRWHHTAGRVGAAAPGRPAHMIGVSGDVTSRVVLETQLRQAQKMEAVGRLAGGVAHDFNNLLQVITGNTLFGREQLPLDSPVRAELAEIDAAAARASALTRQLLAFGRQQVRRPELLRLNDVVTSVERMLSRLINSDVVLVLELQRDLPLVHADAGQVEQVLLNLAVNACDAMPSGGTLVIETRAVQVGGSATGQTLAIAPGSYVAMSVRDTGTGMDGATQAQIFEPFYTTKALGKGTGLGLATVHGIVTQSGGYMQIDSAPGVGSAFTVLLPVADGMTTDGMTTDGMIAGGMIAGGMIAATVVHRSETVPGGGETILLVEDEAAVRAMIRRMLERGGYTVLEARHGVDALGFLTDPAVSVDLVVSDVVMPEMGAAGLLGRLRERTTPTKVLLISGYSRESTARDQGIAPDAELLTKPFASDELLRRVRAVLTAPPAA